MKNKYNVQLSVPSIYKTFDIMIPINKTVGETIFILIKALNELTNNSFNVPNNMYLYNQFDGKKYDLDEFIYNTDIKNGSFLILF